MHLCLILVNYVPNDTLKSLKAKPRDSSMKGIKARLQVSRYLEVEALCVLSSRDTVVSKIGMVPILKQRLY